MLDWKEQLQYVPNGTGTLSKMPCRYPANYPKFIESGKGGLAVASDGKVYVDLIAGLGAISVGYSNSRVNEAIIKQLNKASVVSLASSLECEMSKKLCQLIPGTEMWKFGLNGTDANVMAVRAARAYTKRNYIATIGYNGCADVFECQGIRNAGIPQSLKVYTDRFQYGEIPTLPFACILLEPMTYTYPYDYLQKLRKYCDSTGTLLIFDEVVNGGRFEKFTSSSYFGVQPDIYTIGKGIANGLPLSAVGGTRRIMQVFERSDFFASGTFSTPLISLAAGLETVSILKNTIPSLIEKGKRIQHVFNEMYNVAATALGYPTRLDFIFPTKEHKFLFWQEMCKRGVLIGYSNFVMVDHTDDDIKHVIDAMADTYKTLKENWKHPEDKLEGPLPQEALLRKN